MKFMTSNVSIGNETPMDRKTFYGANTSLYDEIKNENAPNWQRELIDTAEDLFSNNSSN